MLKNQNFELLLYEMKWTEHPGSNDAQVMNAVYAQMQAETHPSIALAGKKIVCRTPHQYPVSESTQVVPITNLFER